MENLPGLSVRVLLPVLWFGHVIDIEPSSRTREILPIKGLCGITPAFPSEFMFDRAMLEGDLTPR